MESEIEPVCSTPLPGAVTADFAALGVAGEFLCASLVLACLVGADHLSG
jgi:hypothetical protein